MVFGFSRIDVCDQSPIVMQFLSGTPYCREPVDGAIILGVDLYIGYGRSRGVSSVNKYDEASPGKFRMVARTVFTFPAK